jgi:hypothetical protein
MPFSKDLLNKEIEVIISSLGSSSEIKKIVVSLLLIKYTGDVSLSGMEDIVCEVLLGNGQSDTVVISDRFTCIGLQADTSRRFTVLVRARSSFIKNKSYHEQLTTRYECYQLPPSTSI